MADLEATFSELWYRVAELRPRLRAAVRTHRQHYRGKVWHVVQDPVNQTFFRLHEAAYRFVGLLNGRRTVRQAWRACNEQLGDEALTQNEAIDVLGRLYAANLLQADLPPDAEGLFQRYRRRRGREMVGRLRSFLFLRIPLFDPDRLFDAAAGVGRFVFTPAGLAIWAALLAAGAWVAASNWGELVRQSRSLWAPGRLGANAALLYAAFVLSKLAHELAHGVACKVFGRRGRGSGEVHAMGIMLLVLAPMPYVDASSAWTLRSRLHRAVVAAAGMMADLALAALAAILWRWTADPAGPWQQALHAAALGLVFIGSIATVAFNANPLLRFDGYYILSDLLEIPNLADRSRRYWRYLVKRFAWGVRGAGSPAQSRAEAAWLAVYGAAAAVFLALVCVKVLLLMMDRFFLLGVALAVAAAVAWVLVPVGKLVHYLAAGAELERVRGRALAVTLAAAGLAAAVLGVVPAPDRWYVEGCAEPANRAYVHAAEDGFVASVLPSGRAVVAGDPNGRGGTLLLSAVNRQRELERRSLHYERQALEARQRIAREQGSRDPRYLWLVQTLEENLNDAARQERIVAAQVESLSVRAPLSGTWVCPRAERLPGSFLAAGQQIGMVATLEDAVVHAEVPQRLAGLLLAEAGPVAEMRILGRPEALFRGRWQLLPAGPKPPDGPASEAGGPAWAGRPEPPAPGRRFTVRLTPLGAGCPDLLPGLPVMVQFELPRRPLIAQWLRAIRQMAQQRFGAQ